MITKNLPLSKNMRVFQAFITILTYTAVTILILGLIITFVDMMELSIVKNFLKDFWHSMAFMAVSLFYVRRMVRFLFGETRNFLRSFGYISGEEMLAQENLELKEELKRWKSKSQ